MSSKGSISFQHVSKTFAGGDRPSVADVTMNVESGTFVVLLGPSGCGKTTLLKMTNRLIEPTSGRISIDSTDISTLPGPELRRGIGYVIQQTGLFPHMRIEENVAVVPKLLKWDRARTNDRVNELLELVGLPADTYRRRYPAQLSGGEQQRVGLARALAAEPNVLLMDEPFGALDAITRTRLQTELRQIHHRLKPTILFVTHDIEEAVRLADVIVVIRTGQIVQTGSPLDIVLRPANDFVRNLVGSDEVMRRLSLITVGTVATSASAPSSSVTITSSSSLRDALGLLLESGQRKLSVVNEQKVSTGTIDLDLIQSASTDGWYPETGR